MATQSEKQRLVSEILENETYTPESGLYRRLHDRLMRMAKDDLASLLLVIRQKQEFRRYGED